MTRRIANLSRTGVAIVALVALAVALDDAFFASGWPIATRVIVGLIAWIVVCLALLGARAPLPDVSGGND